jgi:hypothetical protein
MIYLIITTSIHNNLFSPINQEKRKEQYVSSISHTLSILPNNIQPIIVENNGKRETYLDQFRHFNQSVPVIYTDNNQYSFKNKGVNELLDIKDVIEKMGIKDDDMIIKLTGRYRLTSPLFFNEIMEKEKKYDTFIKFYGSHSFKFELYDCILGLYAIKALYLKLLSHHFMNLYESPEISFAKYIRTTLFRIYEIQQLDLECIFSDDGRILVV